MNQKQLGVIILIIGIIMLGFTYSSKVREDAYMKVIMSHTGSCFLEDGTCLHADRSFTFLILGGVLSSILILLGIYISFIDKTQDELIKHQEHITSALKEAKIQEKSKDEFRAFLQGFSENEQKVLKAIHEQDGILQSTLRYRLGMGKASLSLMLKSLEERQFISRKPEGKTNKVFLRKNF